MIDIIIIITSATTRTCLRVFMITSFVFGEAAINLCPLPLMAYDKLSQTSRRAPFRKSRAYMNRWSDVSYLFWKHSITRLFRHFPFCKYASPYRSRKCICLPFRESIPCKLLSASVTKRHVFSFHTNVTAWAYRIAGNLVSVTICPTLGDLTGYQMGHSVQHIIALLRCHYWRHSTVSPPHVHSHRDAPETNRAFWIFQLKRTSYHSSAKIDSYRLFFYWQISITCFLSPLFLPIRGISLHKTGKAAHQKDARLKNRDCYRRITPRKTTGSAFG